MNKKNNIFLIPNINKYTGYYSHLDKNFITAYMSTSNINMKKEKRNILNFLINFFIFILLIWILQCFNNCDSCSLWNNKRDLKSVINVDIKRSLAESKNTTEQISEELKCYKEKDTIEIDLNSRNDQREMEENIEVELKNELETMKDNEKVKTSEGILQFCKGCLKIVSLSIAFILSFCSSVLITAESPHFGPKTPYDRSNIHSLTILTNLSLMIISIILIHERVVIKYKKKR
ncbi:fam-h protein [Plasmodium gallinaceum]|uniref:Fam-h protein n=1 Tax=Plasmodium gallinaceum TaxID=5849 RepID=A0A1J1GNM9_PLAGA|nr:fam-h protein [Plasmodium gallinaceum]CRG94058.1 fam-h protein [Plasmodium gallinaceum]